MNVPNLRFLDIPNHEPHLHNDLTDIENVLECIRKNAIMYSNLHRKKYIELLNKSKYYKVPIIVISSVSSLVSVGESINLPREFITAFNAIAGLVVSIICAVELFMRISIQLAESERCYKLFYELASKIYKAQITKETKRQGAETFLESCFGEYVALIENSTILPRSIEDKLLPIDVKETVTHAVTPRLGFSERFTRFSFSNKDEEDTKDNKV